SCIFYALIRHVTARPPPRSPLFPYTTLFRSLKMGDDPLVRAVEDAGAPLQVGVLKADVGVARAVEENLPLLRREFADGHVGVDAVLAADAGEHPRQPAAAAVRPRDDPALRQRLSRVEHPVRVDLHLVPQTVAGGTRPVRRVEREHPGRKLFKADAAVDA